MGASMPSDKSALFLLASAAMEETDTTCDQEDLSIEIQETQERKMNKKQRKEERTYTHF